MFGEDVVLPDAQVHRDHPITPPCAVCRVLDQQATRKPSEVPPKVWRHQL